MSAVIFEGQNIIDLAINPTTTFIVKNMCTHVYVSLLYMYFYCKYVHVCIPVLLLYVYVYCKYIHMYFVYMTLYATFGVYVYVQFYN